MQRSSGSRIFSHPLSIDRIVKMKQRAKAWKQRAQARLAKHRKHCFEVIKEWINTQTNYVRDLNIIIHNIKTPMDQTAILTKEQQKIVFVNIDAILILSQRLLEELILIRDNWKPDTILISEKLNKFYPYFKIYSEYYNNYHDGWNIIAEIRHLEDVQEIAKALTMDFESYLIKPIQRPPKYQLLMNQYWQHMPRTHPDYIGVKETIEKYRKVNSENNNQLDQKQNIAQIIRLGRIYSELVKPGRELIKEFTAATFFNPLVKVYLLTDLILLTKQENSKEFFERAIELDGSRSFVDYKTNKYCNDLTLIVCGIRDSIHLKFSNKNLMQGAQKAISSVLIDLLCKQKAKIEVLNKKFSKRDEGKTTTAVSLEGRQLFYSPFLKVVTVGMYKKQVSLLKNQTYYILKLSSGYSSYHQLVCVSFHQISKLRDSLCLEHPSVSFPLLSPNLKQYTQLSVSDMADDSDNKTSFRMLCLPEFLNFVFRCEKVMSNPLIVLNVLRLEENFWQYSNQKEFQVCECNICTKPSNPITIRECMHQRFYYIRNNETLKQKDYCIIKHMKDRKQLLNIPTKEFQTLEERLMYLDYFQGKIDYSMIYRRNKNLPYIVKISLMNLDYTSIQIKVNEESTVGEVIGEICRTFRIYSYQDFGIFIQSQCDPEMRLLDEDQYVLEILKRNEKNIQSAQKGGFLSTIKSIHQWSKGLFKVRHTKLYFGKYIFLDPELQKSACQRSTVRYWLTIQQIFFNIHKKIIILGESELKRIAVLYLCLRLQDEIKILNKENFPTDKVCNLVGNEVMTSKWITEVIKIIDIEKELVEKPNFLMIINDRVFEIAQNKFGWRSMIFQVPQSKRQKDYLYLSLSMDGLTVIKRNTNELVLKIPMRSLKYKISLSSVFVEFQELEVRFEIKNAYIFGKLAEKYMIVEQLFRPTASEIISQY